MRYTNIYYFRSLQRIGGIETFLYELAKKYNDYDLTIIYENADLEQLKRLKKYVRCVKYNGEKIECEKAFFNFNVDIIDNVEAKEYCLVVHGNYEYLNCPPPVHPKITQYYGVSNDASESYTKLTGLPCKTVYNPLNIEKPKRLLRLCSACRLNDGIKGGSRTIELAKKLDDYCAKNNCNYIWTIFTNQVGDLGSKNVVIMKPRLDILSYVNDADYLIQLSDNFEGYCYTVNEALMLNTPVVITPCNVYEELSIDDTMSIRLNFDLSNADDVITSMFDKVGTFKFQYNRPEDEWDSLLVKSKSTYKEEMRMRYKVEALDTYEKYQVRDTELDRIPKEGEVFEVTSERLQVLLGENNGNRVYVKVIEEPKPEKATKNTKKKKE